MLTFGTHKLQKLLRRGTLGGAYALIKTVVLVAFLVNSVMAMVANVGPLFFELRSKCRDSINSCLFLAFDS